ncbi:MAG: helix-turn-helix domain-containing protein [Candidatus Thermoplasmatota archaeon]|nr:helix-turn-helix domain-containing protein [Candidatus Thermoplasmatota archaeon]
MISQKLLSGKVECKDIVQCVFNLSDFEISVYSHLDASGPSQIKDIAKKMKRDESAVYRAVQKLVSCGICFKETKTIERGGYYHIYTALPKRELKKKVADCVDEWHGAMKKALDHLK